MSAKGENKANLAGTLNASCFLRRGTPTKGNAGHQDPSAQREDRAHQLRPRHSARPRASCTASDSARAPEKLPTGDSATPSPAFAQSSHFTAMQGAKHATQGRKNLRTAHTLCYCTGLVEISTTQRILTQHSHQLQTATEPTSAPAKGLLGSPAHLRCSSPGPLLAWGPGSLSAVASRGS